MHHIIGRRPNSAKTGGSLYIVYGVSLTPYIYGLANWVESIEELAVCRIGAGRQARGRHPKLAGDSQAQRHRAAGVAEADSGEIAGVA